MHCKSFYGGKTLKIKKNDQQLMVEAIKLAVGTTSYLGLSIHEVFEATVQRLYSYYQETKDKCYIETALLHIQAYMEMGFEYEDKAELFDHILEELGTSRQLEFPKAYYYSKKIKANKTQIRSMIVRWPASKVRMNINELVQDILDKVNNKKVGIYYYNSNPTPDNGNDGDGDLYELVVSEKDIYFHDIKRRKYFTIVS